MIIFLPSSSLAIVSLLLAISIITSFSAFAGIIILALIFPLICTATSISLLIVFASSNSGHLTLNIEFWNYHSGCSETNFSCGGIKFKLDYGKYDYKGIELYDIQHKVCDKLSILLCDKLEELGLTIVSKTRHDNEYRFGYHNEKIIVSW